MAEPVLDFSGLLGVSGYRPEGIRKLYDILFGKGLSDGTIASLLSRILTISGGNPYYRDGSHDGLFGFSNLDYAPNPLLPEDEDAEMERQVDYVLQDAPEYMDSGDWRDDFLASQIHDRLNLYHDDVAGKNEWMDRYIDKWLWPAENSIGAGKSGDKYSVYADSAGLNIGPGLHEGTFSNELDYSGNTKYSRDELNRIVRRDLAGRVDTIQNDLRDMGYDGLWARLSDGAKAVLLDINYNAGVVGGSPKSYPKLTAALASGDNLAALSEMSSGNARRERIRQNMFVGFDGDYDEKPFYERYSGVIPDNEYSYLKDHYSQAPAVDLGSDASEVNDTSNTDLVAQLNTPGRGVLANSDGSYPGVDKYAAGGHLFEDGGDERPEIDGWSGGFTQSYIDLPPQWKAAVRDVAEAHGVPADRDWAWYESDDGRRVLAAYFKGIPLKGRVRHNDSPSAERSELIGNGIHQSIIKGNPNADIPTAPYRASGYDVPYIIDKEIRAGGGRFPTNVLDSLAKYAKKTDLSLQDAFGLYKQETSMGSVPYNNTGQLSGEEGKAYDNALMNMNYHREFGSIPANYLVRDFEYDRVGHEVDHSVPPLEHAFKYYKSGRYNPGDPNHTRDVRAAGKELLSAKPVQDWLRSSPYAVGAKVWAE